MRPEYLAAVDWWADAIRGNARQDNGDWQTMALYRTLGVDKDPRPDEESIGRFCVNLLAALVAREDGRFFIWDESNPRLGGYGRVLKVDYDPCPELYDAATAAGIDVRYCSTFPMKTVMWIHPGCVEVRNGYGAEVKVIFGESLREAAA